MTAQTAWGRKGGRGKLEAGQEPFKRDISLRQDKSTGAFGSYVLDDVGILQEPSTSSRSSKFNFLHENKGLIGTFRLFACRHAT